MYRGAYAEIAADDQGQARRTEYAALDIVVARLRAARGLGAHDPAFGAALDSVEALWSLFIKDVASPDNALPAELRKNIVSIGRWIFSKTAALRNAEEGDLSALIDVNVAIRDGLKEVS